MYFSSKTKELNGFPTFTFKIKSSICKLSGMTWIKILRNYWMSARQENKSSRNITLTVMWLSFCQPLFSICGNYLHIYLQTNARTTVTLFLLGSAFLSNSLGKGIQPGMFPEKFNICKFTLTPNSNAAFPEMAFCLSFDTCCQSVATVRIF